MLGGYLNFFLITSSSRCCEKIFWNQRTSGSVFAAVQLLLESKNLRFWVSQNPLVEEPTVLKITGQNQRFYNRRLFDKVLSILENCSYVPEEVLRFLRTVIIHVRNRSKNRGFSRWLFKVSKQSPWEPPVIWTQAVLPSFSVLGIKQCWAGTRNCTNPSPVIKAVFCSS